MKLSDFQDTSRFEKVGTIIAPRSAWNLDNDPEVHAAQGREGDILAACPDCSVIPYGQPGSTPDHRPMVSHAAACKPCEKHKDSEILARWKE